MTKYKSLFLLPLLAALLVYLFISVHKEVKEKTIGDFNLQQLMLAKQAARGIEGFFKFYLQELTDLSQIDDVAQMNQKGVSIIRTFYNNHSDAIRAVTRVDSNGRIKYTIPYDKDAIGSDISRQSHMITILRDHRPVVSEVFTAVQGYQAVAYHVPVFSGHTFQGTLAVLIPFEKISKEYLGNIKIGKSGHAWVISQAGVEIYNPGSKHIGMPIFEILKAYPGVTRMVSEMTMGKEGTATYSYGRDDAGNIKAVKKHAVYFPIHLGNTFWSIAVATPEKEILSTIAGFRNKLLLIASLMVLIGLFYSYYFIRARMMLKEAKQRELAEKALRQSEERFRHFFEHLTIGVALYEAVNDGEDFVFFDMNPAGQKLSQVSIDEIRGKRLSQVFPGIRELGLFQTLQNVWRTGKPENIPSSLYQDGRIQQWVENHVFKLPSGRIVAVYDDQTERVRLEEGLRQAQKMESVGRLAGGIAHDFNNMLSVILGNAEMALEDIHPDQKLYSNLKDIKEAAQRSVDVTRQLLAFARKQTIAPKAIHLNEVIENILKMLRRLIGEDIDLLWIPGRQLWRVKMDPSQLDQILANLSINARDAITGEGRLTIETGNVTIDKIYCDNHPGFSPGDFVQLTVSDNGCGMDQEVLKNLFEPFYTTKDVNKGTGLGLATVYGIVKQNNGFINVYSEPDKGTSFKIYLPRHRTSGEQLHAQDKAGAVLRGSECILIVEDELSILKMTAMMIEGMGYNVVAANSPGEAINLAREHKGEIHLLLTDVVMPKMNGRELFKSLRPIYPNLKSLFMSGYTANVIAHHGMLDEGINYIQKPFSKQGLSIKLREILDDISS